jgi:competence protein ComEC
LLTGLSALLLFLALRTNSFYSAGIQNKIIVYNIAGTSAIELISGRNSLLITDSVLLKNESLIRFHIQPSHILHRIQHVYSPPWKTGAYAFSAGSTNMLLIRGPINIKSKTEIIVITHNPRGTISSLVSGTKPAMIVFDASNPRYKVNQWMTECRQLGIIGFSVYDKGAFVMNLN